MNKNEQNGMNKNVPFLSQASLKQDRQSIRDNWAKHNSDQADPEIHKQNSSVSSQVFLCFYIWVINVVGEKNYWHHCVVHY